MGKHTRKNTLIAVIARELAQGCPAKKLDQNILYFSVMFLYTSRV
jgi:hypothetical protein